MFCGKCGAKNEDTAVFCVECGAELNAVQPAANEQAESIINAVGNSSDDKNRKVGIIVAVAAVVVALVVVLAIVLGGSGYKKPVKNFFDGFFDMDMAKVVKTMPEEYLEEEMDYYGYEMNEMDEFIEEYNEDLEEELEELIDEIGEFDVSYKFLNDEDIDGSDLRDIQDEYDDDYNIEVDAAKNVQVLLTVESEDGTESTTVDVPLIKADGSWYIDYENFYFW